MIRFILGKLLYLVPTFLGITIIAFGFVRILPGDPVLLMAGERGISPERHAELSAQLGFDRPLWVQYFDFLGRLFHGDLGNSLVTKKPVMAEFLTLFPATVELGLVAILIATLIGVPVGVLAAIKRGSWFDQVSMTAALVGLFDADLLVGPAADHLLFRHPGLDAGVGPHLADVFLSRCDRLHADRQPAVGAEGRVHLGAVAPDPAVGRAGDHPAGGDRAADPLGHAGGDGRRLRPHRPRQGHAAVAASSACMRCATR